MITLLLLIPLIGSLILLPIQSNSLKNEVKMKKIALSTSLLNFIISIYLWVQFDSSITSYQFVYDFNNLSFCHLNIGVDGISLYFVLLTAFVTLVALLSNYNIITNNIKYFLKVFVFILPIIKKKKRRYL